MPATALPSSGLHMVPLMTEAESAAPRRMPLPRGGSDSLATAKGSTVTVTWPVVLSKPPEASEGVKRTSRV